MQYRTGNPLGGFPTSPRIIRLRISPAGRCAPSGRSRSADIALTGLPPTARNHPTTSDICLPDIPEPLSLHIYSQSRIKNMSGLSLYCCSTCQGCHRTAVLRVRAFTVLLFYSYLNYTQTGISMYLPNYPLNRITKHLYLESNNTLYLLTKSCIPLSQDCSNN